MSICRKAQLLRRFGLPSTATESDLKQAYFRSAKLLHPDVAKGQNGTRFVEASAAYEEARDLLRKHSKKNESSRQTGQGPQGSSKYDQHADAFHHTQKNQQSHSENASNNLFQVMQAIPLLFLIGFCNAGLWCTNGRGIVSTESQEKCTEIKGSNSARVICQCSASCVPHVTVTVSSYYRTRSHKGKKGNEAHDWIHELKEFRMNQAF